MVLVKLHAGCRIEWEGNVFEGKCEMPKTLAEVYQSRLTILAELPAHGEEE